MNRGYLCIVLHAHLPYVHHPEHDRFFEENWLFEAITECYLPLIEVLERLERDGVACRLTVSLSPTLMTMLQDALLQQRYIRHLEQRLQLADQEKRRTRHQPALHRLADGYQRAFLVALDRYKQHYQCDLLAPFAHHAKTGRLELITTAATHGFLPLLNVSEAAVISQIETGIDCFRRYFGFRPAGFWLPECAYYLGVERLLQRAGIRYFFVDSHGLLDAKPTPQKGVYAPIDCGNGVMALGRDPACSRQVWSADQGYPGDAAYREYHRDIGFDLPLADMAPYLLNDGSRISTGIKYYRVTGKTEDKALYQPDQAQARARQHARDFIDKRRQQVDALHPALHGPPLIVAPYDAELFGHWWFEGPVWLESVLRIAAETGSPVKTLTVSDYLARHPKHAIAHMQQSTWGDQGYADYWLNASNDWIYPLLHKAGAEMEKLARDIGGLPITALQERALNQALRSLLLAQASDWPFILRSGTTVDYAKQRIIDNLARFNYLHDAIRKNRLDQRYLTALEIMDDIFPDIDFRRFRPDTSGEVRS
ncbi:MAG: DUF1957 domain-containing protein [Methylomonas sp.]|nr:DUF1957 domain-containing protein [Methylomonas sp.]PPD19270.1 MAG: glycoside hydrolase [Methylomonas sp.]PPD24091.1 MAG: glycoside hydrolase [Methylomonas sp.]PPD32594.1 MAG: glycoside hydrolase [Methylomonas sp.]PPD54888.1 MAG: glycoside hydrolase [Methylomonas sp.]